MTRFFRMIDFKVVRNISFMILSILIFLVGVVVYGIILNLREIPLKEVMVIKGIKQFQKPNIVIDRSTFSLSLFDDTTLVKTYKASFGRNVKQPKKIDGDGGTPVGVYKICSIDTASEYHKFFKINYPNLKDAEEVLRRGGISLKEFENIKFNYYYSDCTPFSKILGGNIGIHGIGRLNFIFKNLPFVYNWTNGSIALSNENIDELYSVVKKGTKVVIK